MPFLFKNKLVAFPPIYRGSKLLDYFSYSKGFVPATVAVAVAVAVVVILAAASDSSLIAFGVSLSNIIAADKGVDMIGANVVNDILVVCFGGFFC